MGVTINLSSGGKMASLFSNNSMLKSTREKFQRQAECDSKVAFFEAQKEKLKNTEASDIEGIERKLELFHSYEDEITAARQEYNSSQMFHAMDEARELGEKLAKAAEKNKPKTEEERKNDAIKEASGDESGDGMLSEVMDALDEIQEKQLDAAQQNEDVLLQPGMKDDTLKESQAADDSAESEMAVSYAKEESSVGAYMENGDAMTDKYGYRVYKPFDVRV